MSFLNPVISVAHTETRNLQRRNACVGLGVLVLHIGLIWAAQQAWVAQAPEQIISIDMIGELVDSPSAKTAKPPSPEKTNPPKTLPVTPAPQRQPEQPKAAPAASPLAAVDAPAVPAAPTGALAPATSTPANNAAPSAATPAMPPAQNGTAGAAASVQLPSSNADYLQNPKPPYPPLSARLGETGKVIYKVWIGVDGKAQRAELVTSSGFSRLDKAAYDTVMSWRYVPGKRNGVAEAMPFNVPINWELRN